MTLFRTLASIRVLFLSTGQAVALTRSRAGLASAGRFRADGQGREALGRWLRTSPRCPVYLVADLAEEEFHREIVPHVRWPERAAFFAGKLSRLFPGTAYRCARVQGREKSGRRDDLVLFSALPGNAQLAFWVETVLENRAPLAGITSVPMLSEDQAALEHPHVPQLLLVSLQQDTGLRQSYLLHGRLQFSRFLPGFGQGQGEILAENLMEECSRTRQYLERQKLLLTDQVLEIHIHAESAQYECFAAVHSAHPLLRLYVHNAGVPVHQRDRGKEEEISGVGSFFLRFLRSIPRLPNHYAPPFVLRNQRLCQFRRSVVAGAGILAVLACFAAFSLYSQGVGFAARQEVLRGRTHSLQQRHVNLLRAVPEAPLEAGEMRRIVEFIAAVDKAPSPLTMMRDVSLALAECPEIRLHRFVWQAAALTASDQGSDGRGPGSTGEAVEPERLLAAAANGKTGVILLLAGSVASFSGPRGVHQALGRFVAVLEARSGFTVLPVRLPLETRSDIGLHTSLKDQVEPDSLSFVLQLASKHAP